VILATSSGKKKLQQKSENWTNSKFIYNWSGVPSLFYTNLIIVGSLMAYISHNTTQMILHALAAHCSSSMKVS